MSIRKLLIFGFWLLVYCVRYLSLQLRQATQKAQVIFLIVVNISFSQNDISTSSLHRAMVQVKIKKPAAILFDFSGTCVQQTFVEKHLMPYYKVAYKAYFEANWEKPDCQEDVKALSTAAAGDSAAPKIDAAGDKKAAIEQLGRYAEYCDKSGKNHKAFVMYRFHVWFDGYERGKLTTPVYADVAKCIQKW